MNDRSRRIALANEIMTLRYRDWGVGWLKVVPVGDVKNGVAASEGNDARAILEAFFMDHFGRWTPEDSPYSDFVAGPWEPASRAEVARVLDKVVSRSGARLRKDRKVGEYQGEFADYSSLRRWFEEELFAADAERFVLRARGSDTPVPAIAAMDDLLIGVVWLA